MNHDPTPSETALANVEPECLVVIETGDHRWDRARKLFSEAKQAFLRNIDAQVMLGGELLALQTSLGFNSRGGDRKSKTQVASLISQQRTWADWCQAELGLSHDSAGRFIACFKLIQSRAKRIGEDSLACRLLSTPATDLEEGDYKVLSEVLRKLIGEQSQTELLREYNLLRRPNTLGGDTAQFSKPKDPFATPEGASIALDTLVKVIADSEKIIFRERTNPAFEGRLFMLPLDPAPPNIMGLSCFRDRLAGILSEMIQDVEKILERVDAAILNKGAHAQPKAKKSPRRNQKQQPNR